MKGEHMQNAMRTSRMFPAVGYEDPAVGRFRSHKLLVRCGFISQASPGVHAIGPLGLRVLKKIEQIIREEHDRRNCLEVELPILQESKFWEESGRWGRYIETGTMFTTRTTQSKLAEQTTFGLSPTAEELVVWFAKEHLRSYKSLPMTLYQIGEKFRCEIRPRGGLLRGRQFGMKDAYSFDIDEAGMKDAYQMFIEIYTAIFERMGFNFIHVQADSGAIGGQGSAEFMALSEDGDDTLLTCTNCSYGANQEKAVAVLQKPDNLYGEDIEEKEIRKEHTPNIRTVEELKDFFAQEDIQESQMVKTIIFNADGKPVAVCMRGDLEINEVKLANELGCTNLEPADDLMVREATGAPVGFAGPVGGKLKVERILFDVSVQGLKNFLCGCCEEDYHMLDVNLARDVGEPEKFYNLHNAVEGDTCAECNEGTLKVMRGIEIGHVFQLQQGYAEAMNLTFTGQDGKQHTPWMGCYGIGTTRCLQALAEQTCDEKGLNWPAAVAPYQVVIVPVNWKNDEQKALAEALFDELAEHGAHVVLDDRTEKFGSKMREAELIGYPLQIIIGKRASENIVEMKSRSNPESKREVDLTNMTALYAALSELS